MNRIYTMPEIIRAANAGKEPMYSQGVLQEMLRQVLGTHPIADLPAVVVPDTKSPVRLVRDTRVCRNCGHQHGGADSVICESGFDPIDQ